MFYCQTLSLETESRSFGEHAAESADTADRTAIGSPADPVMTRDRPGPLPLLSRHGRTDQTIGAAPAAIRPTATVHRNTQHSGSDGHGSSTAPRGKGRMNDTHDHGPSPEMADSGADWRSWNPSRRRFLTLTGLAVGGTVIGVSAAGCGTAQTGSTTGTASAAGRAGASGDTLVRGGLPVEAAEELQPDGGRRLTGRPPLARASSSTRACCGSTSWTARSSPGLAKTVSSRPTRPR